MRAPEAFYCFLRGPGISLGFKRANEEPLRCSFCGKDQNSVGKLVSNPDDYSRVYICNECVRICSSIIDDDNPTIAEAETEIGESSLDRTRYSRTHLLQN